MLLTGTFLCTLHFTHELGTTLTYALMSTLFHAFLVKIK
jgi:hypothetical protein